MLNPDHSYELRDADKGMIGSFNGSELANGFTITHPHPRSAALIYIDPHQADARDLSPSFVSLHSCARYTVALNARAASGTVSECMLLALRSNTRSKGLSPL